MRHFAAAVEEFTGGGRVRQLATDTAAQARGIVPPMETSNLHAGPPMSPLHPPFHLLLFLQLIAAFLAFFVVTTFGVNWGAASREKGYSEPVAEGQGR
jgi:hypothetical protein